MHDTQNVAATHILYEENHFKPKVTKKSSAEPKIHLGTMRRWDRAHHRGGPRGGETADMCSSGSPWQGATGRAHVARHHGHTPTRPMGCSHAQCISRADPSESFRDKSLDTSHVFSLTDASRSDWKASSSSATAPRIRFLLSRSKDRPSQLLTHHLLAASLMEMAV